MEELIKKKKRKVKKCSDFITAWGIWSILFTLFLLSLWTQVDGFFTWHFYIMIFNVIMFVSVCLIKK